MLKSFFSLILVFAAFMLFAQTPAVEKIRYYRMQHQAAWMDEFISFLSIPNIASVPSDMQLNATRIMELMKERSIKNIQLLYPTTKNAPPSVYGEVLVPGATQTIFFYAHYDGQPVDSTKWLKGTHPFKPVMTAYPLKDIAFEPFK